MSTAIFQYILLNKLKFGFSILFRCINCFFNIAEKLQFMSFASTIGAELVPYITCPYCEDKTYIFESEPGNYNLLFTSNQTPLATLTIKMQGTNTKKYTIIWGDNTLSTGVFDGTYETFTHDYAIEDNYSFKIFVEDSHLINLRISDQNIINTIPALNQFINAVNLHLYNNNLSGTIPVISNLTNLLSLDLHDNDLSGNIPTYPASISLKYLYLHKNNLSGNIPAFTNCKNFIYIYLYDNNLSGNIPTLSILTQVYIIYLYDNNLSGSIPSLSGLDKLLRFFAYNNNLSGTVPDLSSCVKIEYFRCYSNSITSYTASIISLSCIDFRLNDNLLSQAAVDQVLSDFNDNLASRPGSGYINLGGTGNAAPSAAGLIHKANIIAHGWTCLTN